MAAPTQSGTELVQLVHTSAVGTSQGGWSLDAKTAGPFNGLFATWFVTITGTGNRVFTATYTEQADGTVGKFRDVTDVDGVPWGWTGTAWIRLDA